MKLEEISFGRDTVVIFHGNDRDSVLAFRELIYFLTDKNVLASNIDELAFYSIDAAHVINYDVYVHNGDVMVFFVGSVEYSEIHRAIHTFGKDHVTWFCNDDTSVQVAQANDIGNTILGIRTTILGLTLADLVYLYFYTDIRSDAHGTLYHKENPDIIYNNANSSELMLQFPPSFMEKYRNSLFFQGKILSEPEDYQIKQIEQWIEHICKIDPVLYEYADDFIDNNNRGMEALFEMTEPTMATALYIGSILFSNTSREYMDVYKDSAFKAALKKFPEYSVVAINYSRATKDIFLYEVDDYELGLLFWFDGFRMNYEIYRLGANPDKFISCKTIAESYGGRGSTDKGSFKTIDSTLVFEPVV